MPKLFPAFHTLEGRRVVIVGGGEAAARKARLVHGIDVDLALIWPCFDAAVVAEWGDRARLVDRAPSPDDFKGAALAFVAIEDETEARRVAAIARAAGVPVNVVDRPAASDFFTPSIVDRGEVMVAISTGGAAPVLGRSLRAQIEAMLPDRIGALAAFGRSFRGAVAARVSPARRRAVWEQVFGGDIAQAFLAGRETSAHERMIALVNAGGNDGDARGRPGGVVHIVGAGPGDPELLTLRALRLIQSADVILYDRLVGDGVLGLARRDATRIFVGKAKANHAVPQEEIHDRLVALAGEGKNVVRLKGGDPFVFGRGGEELEALRAAGVDAYITPGVTAALGCAASAGLPLTHRDHAQSVTLVTGHGRDGAAPDLNWRALAALNQTVVFYMGVETAATISARLIAAGLAPSTPAAIIENGTRVDEVVIKTSLADLPRVISQSDIAGPAIIVVGATAALAAARDARPQTLERLSA